LRRPGVVDRQPGIVAEFGPWDAVRLVLVIERRPLASEIALRVGRSAGEYGEDHDQATRSHRALL
jgi:hypothetical protein